MKMHVENMLKNVKFSTNSCGNWNILLNGVVIKYYDKNSDFYMPKLFECLNHAVDYAKQKGYLPQSFKVESIQDETAAIVESA